MQEVCPSCGQKISSPRPPKYSPLDKYAKYRRMAKEIEGKQNEQLENKEINE